MTLALCIGVATMFVVFAVIEMVCQHKEQKKIDAAHAALEKANAEFIAALQRSLPER